VRDSKTLKLLLIEDSFEDQHLLREALIEIEENRLWSNWRTSNILPLDRLADALDCLRADTFDAVLLNLSLPDSPSLLDSFLEVNACAGCTPVLVMADEPDEHLANRLLREGAQDVLVKSELECAPLSRAIRYAIERQRRLCAAQSSAFVDHLTGVLTRDAFLTVAAHRGHRELLGLVEIPANREAANREIEDPLLIQAAEELSRVFEAPAVLGRWDRLRLCVLAPEGALHRAASHLLAGGLQMSIANLDEMPGGVVLPLRAKTAMLAD
jgi:PleD family two-component response regulator